MIRIGIASFAHLHADFYAACFPDVRRARLIGIADDDAGRGAARAEQYGVQWFPRYEDLLQAVDAVIVTSENARHKEWVLGAAAAGKHVLCEKPIATTLEDARGIIEACARHRVKLQTAFPAPFSPAFAQLRRLVADGAVGTVLALNCTNHGQMPGGWFTDRALAGGGAVMDHTVHVADLLRRLLGGEVQHVYAEIGSGLYHLPIDDSGVLTLEFADGVFASLDTSWSRPKSFPIWGDLTMQVVGTRGTLAMDMFRQNLTLHSDQTMRTHYVEWGPNLNREMIEDFVAAIAEDRAVRASGEDGLRALEVALAAYRSAELGRPVQLPLA